MDLSKVDFSKLSDAALSEIAKGAKSDFSKLPDADLKVIAAGPDKGFGPTADGKPRSPLAVNWLGAVADEVINGRPNVVNATVAHNPLLAAGPPTGVVPLVGAGPSVLSPLGRIASAIKGRVMSQAPEIARDVGTYLAGSAYDRLTGNDGGRTGLGAAIARRVLTRGK